MPKLFLFRGTFFLNKNNYVCFFKWAKKKKAPQHVVLMWYPKPDRKKIKANPRTKI